jgi:dTDP-4-amino-4,6-dideoxygalactose transaminase
MHIIGKEEAEAASRVIESGHLFRYLDGVESETGQFEKTWAERIGVKYAIAVSSGTAALVSALAGLGLGPGDEVIVPAYTFMATATSVLSVGAVPVPAEVDETLTIDPADVQRKISPRTRAIIPVHMAGLPCDMDAIMPIAEAHDLLVLEDVAQAAGGSYKGRALGSIGNAGAFSFNYYKLISCGEGGAMTTNDHKTYLDALIFHDSGTVSRGDVVDTPYFAGTNFRFNEILSAILRVQETRLDGILSALRAEKYRLMDELAGLSAFQLNPVHDPQGDCASVLGLLFEEEERAVRFAADLNQAGFGAGRPIDLDRHVYSKWTPLMIGHGAHHPGRDPLQQSDVVYSEDMCPRTLSLLSRTVHLPMRVDRSPEELTDLVSAIKRIA